MGAIIFFLLLSVPFFSEKGVIHNSYVIFDWITNRKKYIQDKFPEKFSRKTLTLM